MKPFFKMSKFIICMPKLLLKRSVVVLYLSSTKEYPEYNPAKSIQYYMLNIYTSMNLVTQGSCSSTTTQPRN